MWNWEVHFCDRAVKLRRADRDLHLCLTGTALPSVSTSSFLLLCLTYYNEDSDTFTDQSINQSINIFMSVHSKVSDIKHNNKTFINTIIVLAHAGLNVLGTTTDSTLYTHKYTPTFFFFSSYLQTRFCHLSVFSVCQWQCYKCVPHASSRVFNHSHFRVNSICSGLSSTRRQNSKWQPTSGWGVGYRRPLWGPNCVGQKWFDFLFSSDENFRVLLQEPLLLLTASRKGSQ